MSKNFSGVTKSHVDESRPISMLALCNPLMDYITRAGFDFLKEAGVVPGSMNLIDNARRNAVISQMRDYRLTPGGSGANTLRGFCLLNRAGMLPSPVYWGAVGTDEIGCAYARMLEEAGVKTGLARKGEETGVSIVIVTPDHERTMFTFLGACRLLTDQDVDLSLIQQARLLHITGYMWDTENQRELTKKAAALARQNGTAVSFDLADPFVVERYRDDFCSWIPENVDLLFGNRDEFSILCGGLKEETDILAAAKNYGRIRIMKVGAQGAYVCSGDECRLIPGKKADVIDTTGAGDAFAGGFLYEYLRAKPLAQCAESGNSLASAIVEVEGCDYSKIAAD